MASPDTRPAEARDAAAATAPAVPKSVMCGPVQLRPDGSLFSILPVPQRPLRIGASSNGSSPFAGDLDEARFYDRALTPEEAAHRFQGMAEPCAPQLGCVAAYAFDRLENGAFADGGRHGLAAAVVKQPMALVDGVSGKAARFDNTGWLEIPAHPTLEWTRGMSFEAWARWRGPCPPGYPAKCNFYNLFDRYGEGTTSTTAPPRSGLRLDMHVGPSLRFSLSTGVFHDDRILEAERWVHVMVTFDDTRGVRFYRNGQPHESCVLA